ncbi:MAG: hypothetical protein ACTSRI_06955 [Promethearchaeota archaeon]
MADSSRDLVLYSSTGFNRVIKGTGIMLNRIEHVIKKSLWVGGRLVG